MQSNIKERISEIRNQCNLIKPLLVVRCITYNHENYIHDALNGFVMQKTKFPFVAIVHDDASTDRTADIIGEYAEKYPNIILPIFEKENQYSKQDGSIGNIMNKAIEATGAKYIAMCEGDDYWIDSCKLQKQVDYLEAHSDYTMCFTSASVVYENLNITKISNAFNRVESRDYDIKECFNNWIIPTCTIVYRSYIIDKIPLDNRFKVGDNVLTTTCFKYGKVRAMKELTATYRRTISGWTSQSIYDRSQLAIDHTKVLKEYFHEYRSVFDKYLVKCNTTRTLYSLMKFDRRFFTYVSLGFKDFGMRYVLYLMIHPVNSLLKKCLIR